MQTLKKNTLPRKSWKLRQHVIKTCSYGAKNVDFKTVGYFSQKVKRGVRVLRARSARAGFSLVPDLLFDCSRVLEYAKRRTVLQSAKNVANFTTEETSRQRFIGQNWQVEMWETTRRIMSRFKDGSNPMISFDPKFFRAAVRSTLDKI